MNCLLPLLLLSAAITLQAQTQDTIRVCSYNVLNFGNETTATRKAAAQSVIRAIQPHLIVVQGIKGVEGIESVLEQIRYAVAPRAFAGSGEDGRGTDNVIAYDTLIFLYPPVSIPILTPLRDISHWILVFREHRQDTLHVFGCDLKDGDTNDLARFEGAMLIRVRIDSLPPSHSFILCGDLNVNTSSEGAYLALTTINPDIPSNLVDPIPYYGIWHSNKAFANIHTQSTRITLADGGASGGLDDRFDFVMISPKLNEGYLPGSYTTFGNDGRHFKDSVNHLPNFAVPDSIAQALNLASDHLPVYLDMIVPKPSSGVPEMHGSSGTMDLSEGRNPGMVCPSPEGVRGY